MIARFVMAAALLTTVMSTADDKKDEKKSDKDLLQGEWVVVSVEFFGKKIEGEKDRKVVVKGDEWTAPTGGLFKFKLDETKKPKQLDLTGGKAPVGATWQGIYQIEGDTLTFCRSQGTSGERPKEFKAAEGVFLMVCKRGEREEVTRCA